MTDISQTAANVVPGSNAKIDRDKNFGGTVIAGNAVYLTAANKWVRADNNVSAVEAGSLGVGIALNGGADGQPAAVQTEGDINLGATLVLGETYIISATAGGIAPVADISTNFVTVLGVAKTTALLALRPIVSGSQRAA